MCEVIILCGYDCKVCIVRCNYFIFNENDWMIIFIEYILKKLFNICLKEGMFCLF